MLLLIPGFIIIGYSSSLIVFAIGLFFFAYGKIATSSHKFDNQYKLNLKVVQKYYHVVS